MYKYSATIAAMEELATVALAAERDLHHEIAILYNSLRDFQSAIREYCAPCDVPDDYDPTSGSCAACDDRCLCEALVGSLPVRG